MRAVDRAEAQGSTDMEPGAQRPLEPGDLLTLEDYARRRPELRRAAMAEKRRRQIAIGQHARLFFENRATMRYQIQEMLRAERIFEPEGIADELAAYNPLIPDGDNWKATLMFEYPNADERRAALRRLVGVERCVWMRIGSGEPVFAVADEDRSRSDCARTSAVHFLRFQLTMPQCQAVRRGASVAVGIDHPAFAATVDALPAELAVALREDLTLRD